MSGGPRAQEGLRGVPLVVRAARWRIKKPGGQESHQNPTAGVQKAITKSAQEYNSLAYALKKSFFSAPHALHTPCQRQNHVDNIQINGYTDCVVAAGFSVFVGFSFELFPTFAVAVVEHLTVAAAIIMTFLTGIVSQEMNVYKMFFKLFTIISSFQLQVAGGQNHWCGAWKRCVFSAPCR